MHARTNGRSRGADKPAALDSPRLALGLRGCELHTCGLKLRAGLSETEWRSLGPTINAVASAAAWALGDWIAYGERKYGDLRAAVGADDWNGPSYSTCATYASVGRRFESCRRRELLTFSHHAEVAYPPPREADSLLDWCENGFAANGKPRSVRALQAEKLRREHARAARFRASARPAQAGALTVNLIIEEESAKPERSTSPIEEPGQAPNEAAMSQFRAIAGGPFAENPARLTFTLSAELAASYDDIARHERCTRDAAIERMLHEGLGRYWAERRAG